jgi:nucleoside-diphosphate-sugar epimerase
MWPLLLTGSTGFIGSTLKSKLMEHGFDIAEINSGNGGVTNPETFEGLWSQSVAHVFHLAGRTFVPESWETPATYTKINVYGTQNVLEFCRKKGVSLTFVSTYLYGRPDSLPVAEDSPIRPNNPYAHSKYLAEQLCSFYAREFHLRVNIIRPFNAYGIGQDRRYLIPSVIDQALHGEAIRVADLSPKRDYVHVEDLVDALICSMTHKGKSSVYNIGSGSSISVQGVVDIVQEILGTDKPVISRGSIRKNEIHDVIADTTRARTELNWYPKYSFYQGIKQIIENEAIINSSREQAFA